jgi:hypothetical protein
MAFCILVDALSSVTTVARQPVEQTYWYFWLGYSVVFFLNKRFEIQKSVWKSANDLTPKHRI